MGFHVSLGECRIQGFSSVGVHSAGLSGFKTQAS